MCDKDELKNGISASVGLSWKTSDIKESMPGLAKLHSSIMDFCKDKRVQRISITGDVGETGPNLLNVSMDFVVYFPTNYGGDDEASKG